MDDTLHFDPNPDAFIITDPHLGLENLPGETRVSMPLFLYRAAVSEAVREERERCAQQIEEMFSDSDLGAAVASVLRPRKEPDHD